MKGETKYEPQVLRSMQVNLWTCLRIMKVNIFKIILNICIIYQIITFKTLFFHSFICRLVFKIHLLCFFVTIAWKISFSQSFYQVTLLYCFRFKWCKAAITRCDLSPRFFCIDATSDCGNLKAIRYELTSLNRIAANKSHRVIVA